MRRPNVEIPGFDLLQALGGGSRRWQQVTGQPSPVLLAEAIASPTALLQSISMSEDK